MQALYRRFSAQADCPDLSREEMENSYGHLEVAEKELASDARESWHG